MEIIITALEIIITAVEIFPPRWEYYHRPSRRARTCISGNDYQCRRKWKVRPLPSRTAAPNVRGLFQRHADWRCTELAGAARDSAPPPDGTSSLTKPSKLTKRKASAALFPPVIMEGESLESLCQFDYLGCRFTSDGDDAADMRHRMAIAGERSRSLNYLWSDNRLPLSLKLRLYAASVCSTLTHGSEAWMHTPIII